MNKKYEEAMLKNPQVAAVFHLQSIGKAINAMYSDKTDTKKELHYSDLSEPVMGIVMDALRKFHIYAQKYDEDTIKLIPLRSGLLGVYDLINYTQPKVKELFAELEKSSNDSKNTARYPSYGNSDTE